MKLKIICVIIIALTAVCLAGQPAAALNEGRVTLSEDTHINEAVQILEIHSLKFENKKIINQSKFNSAIGIPLHNIDWRRAMDIIAKHNDIVVEESPGFIAFANIPVTDAARKETLAETLDIGSKQVRINAIAVLADRSFLQSLGIDWSTVFDGKVTVSADFLGGTQVPNPIGSLGMETDFSVNGTQIELSTLLNVIESNQKGTVIAKPNLIVNSGKHGYIQVGQDFSVKMLDEAGNTTERFFSTGVIMHVEPTVVEVEGREVIHLKVSVERSSAVPGAVTTVINKSMSETELVLYDGEEAVIGGLYDTETIQTRAGIPILKDLPWWVLGIRYLTGYWRDEVNDRELVIFLRPDIVENASARAAAAEINPPTPR
ncbi:MAG: type II secretion system protein GspD, partial [Candidatus Syntrophosphaera sp.]